MIFILAICSGIFLGYVCYTLEEFSYLLVGFFQGYFIFGIFINYFGLEQFVKILINIIGGVLFGGICMKAKEKIMIVICALTGSIMAIYMILYLLGFVGNPMDLTERVKDLEKINFRFIPLILAIPLSVVGTLI